MLATGDATLVQRDQALPGLAILLDPDRMAALIASLFACPPLDSLTPNYVRYKPRTSCLVGYEARVADRPIRFYARTHEAGAAEKVSKIMERPHTPGSLGAGAAITLNPPIAVFVFPNDHELRILRKLVDDDHRASKLRKLLPGHQSLHASELRVLRYKPERRLVACLTGRDGTRAVLRAHAQDAAIGIDASVPRDADRNAAEGAWTRRAAAPSHAGAAKGAVRLPNCLGGSTADRVAFYEWIDGEALDSMLASPAADASVLDRVAHALARWHRDSLDRTPPTPIPLESSRHAPDALTPFDNTLGNRATALAARIDATLAGIDLPATRIHGDFSAEQVILTDGGIAFIDLDRARIGLGVEDLATFRARLIADAFAGRWSLTAAATWSERLTESYERERGDPSAPRATAALTARALLRLANEPFRKRLPDWPTKAAEILAAAEEACP